MALDMGGLSGTGPVQRVEVYVRGTSAKGDLLDLESVAGAAKGRNAYEVSFDRLPVGQGYRFSAKAFDAAAGGNVLFETANYLAYVAGAEQPVADIRAGGLAQVFLLLQPVSPPAGFSNAVPVISAIVASDVAIAPFGKTSLKAYWSDADQANYDGKGSNETMTVRWGATQDGSDVSGGLSGPDGNLTDFTAPGTEGDVTLTFVVDDGRGGRTGANFKVQVATANAISGVRVSAGLNHWPVITGMVAANAGSGTGGAELAPGDLSTITVTAEDADLDLLRYDWTTTCGTLSDGPAPGVKILAASAPAGSVCEVAVTVGDYDAAGSWKGGSVSGRLVLTVGTASVEEGPHVALATASSFTGTPGEHVGFMVEGRNASGRFIRYAWAVNGVAVGSGGVTAAADGSSCVFDWVVPAPGTASSYTVTVTLDDGYAPVSSYSFPVMTPPPPLYWRSGVQTDLPVASLAGWTQCFSDTYKDDGTPLASIFSACAGAKLVMACRPVGSDTLTVAAMGARSDVLFETGYADASTTHEANGVAWYFDDNYSWGFANAGDTVQKTACDMEQSSDPEHRLCWHTGLGAPGELRFGWRCGSTVWLNGFPAPYADATTWERIIFTAP